MSSVLQICSESHGPPSVVAVAFPGCSAPDLLDYCDSPRWVSHFCCWPSVVCPLLCSRSDPLTTYLGHVTALPSTFSLRVTAAPTGFCRASMILNPMSLGPYLLLHTSWLTLLLATLAAFLSWICRAKYLSPTGDTHSWTCFVDTFTLLRPSPKATFSVTSSAYPVYYFILLQLGAPGFPSVLFLGLVLIVILIYSIIYLYYLFFVVLSSNFP